MTMSLQGNKGYAKNVMYIRLLKELKSSAFNFITIK